MGRVRDHKVCPRETDQPPPPVGRREAAGRTKRVDRCSGRRPAASAALLAFVASLVVACGPAHGQLAPPAAEVRDITILISGTKNEPRPALTAMATDLLRQQADADVGPHQPGSTATVISADGLMRSTDPVTPRRANGEVEHGLQRRAIENANIAKISADVGATHASKSGLDLLDTIDRATASRTEGWLVVISNGLSTDGALDLREVRWTLTSDELVEQLRTRDVLPDLQGWHVLWLGLNATAGVQEPLPKPIRDKNRDYWMAICQASRAASCAFDLTEVTNDASAAVVETPSVAVPTIQSVPGTAKERTISVPETLLGFAANSAALSADADQTIAQLAAEIQGFTRDHPDSSMMVIGFTADPPGSTVAGRHALSLSRAQAVADALRAAGIRSEITAVGGGAAPHMSCMRSGLCVEALAEPMRRVEVQIIAN